MRLLPRETAQQAPKQAMDDPQRRLLIPDPKTLVAIPRSLEKQIPIPKPQPVQQVATYQPPGQKKDPHKSKAALQVPQKVKPELPRAMGQRARSGSPAQVAGVLKKDGQSASTAMVQSTLDKKYNNLLETLKEHREGELKLTFPKRRQLIAAFIEIVDTKYQPECIPAEANSLMAMKGWEDSWADDLAEAVNSSAQTSIEDGKQMAMRP